MAKEVVIDRDECTSCGQCADDLPDVFAMDDDDIATVVAGHAGSEDDIQEEIDACPGECIAWKE
jgi:ferredoxin